MAMSVALPLSLSVALSVALSVPVAKALAGAPEVLAADRAHLSPTQPHATGVDVQLGEEHGHGVLIHHQFSIGARVDASPAAEGLLHQALDFAGPALRRSSGAVPLMAVALRLVVVALSARGARPRRCLELLYVAMVAGL